MEILGQYIRKGRKASLDLQVARAYDTTKVSIPVLVHRGKLEGESVLVMAGMHGDEVSGMESCRRLLRELKTRPVEKGMLIIIPILNVFGFLTMNRTMPDGKDLNRNFPGSAKGSLTARLAHKLVREVLPHADMVVDLHSGGAQRVNYPQIRYTKGDEKARELARIFDARFTLPSKVIKGSLRSYCSNRNVPYVLMEGGTSALIDERSVSSTEQGLNNILVHTGIWSGDKDRPIKQVHLSNSKWLRSSHAGLLNTVAENGAKVAKGDVIAFVNDPYGRSEKAIRSPNEGYIIAVNDSPAVTEGDPLFHLGTV